MSEEREIYTVSELNHTAKDILENTFPSIWVEGEISNFALPSSGHMYFSLKDENAQVRCAFFRGRNRHLDFVPEDGMQVLVRASVSLYVGRGEFQLIIEHLEEAGAGALQREFEKLKQKLLKEGLFDEEHKQELPSLPKQIGVITSPTGAAIRDILSVLKRRFPSIPVIIYPTQVQGAIAAQQIVDAIITANQRNECDVLLVSRGGGSLEDLWPFNEEKVARAIFASDIPVVSGVGHEVDFTIADFVADKRAPTPSAAAELLSPNQEVILKTFTDLEQQLVLKLKNILQNFMQQVDWLQKRLRHPSQQLREYMQRLDHLEQQMQRIILNHLHKLSSKTNEIYLHLQRCSPLQKIQTFENQLDRIQQSLQYVMQKKLADVKQRYQQLIRSLNTVSPLATLDRGYAIAMQAKTKKIIDDVNLVKLGDSIEVKLKNGELDCTVKTIGVRS